MKVIFMTREYPPHVYGGAGVHVEYLSREMSRLAQVEVLCFGEQELQEPTLRVRGFRGDDPMFEGNDDRAAHIVWLYVANIDEVSRIVDQAIRRSR